MLRRLSPLPAIRWCRMRFGNRTPTRRALIYLIASLLLTSCTTWTARSDVRSALGRAEGVERCRVTFLTGAQLVLLNAVLVGDTLTGTADVPAAPEWRIALAEIQKIEVYRVDAVETAKNALIAVAVAGLVFLGLGGLAQM